MTEATDVIDEDLYQRTKRLLEPGDIDLNGIVVHTDLGLQEDIQMTGVTVEVGNVVAEHAGHDPDDVYVYSGNDDPDFASNQHQGLTVADDEFVWECQQLLRENAFALVFYYEASADQAGIVEAIEENLGYDVTSVEGE
ncbi:MAG TPA: DUF5778 family protein [Natrialbaceae archaeon]|nr:DUF5778 family protein [Natrialbaceae archaeon]